MQEKEYQLFFLPYAGGNAAVYNEIIQRLPDNIEAYTVEYSGHGRRIKEQFATSMYELVEDAAKQINELIDEKKKTAVFGYSMGTVVGYELIARKLLGDEVYHFFAAAQEDVRINSFGDRLGMASEQDIIAHAIGLGGIDERLQADERFLQAFLKPLINDYHIRMSYQPETISKLSCDMTVMYSEQDTPYDTVVGWNEMTCGKTELYSFEGNHFFMKKYPDKIADIIQRKLRIEQQNERNI